MTRFAIGLLLLAAASTAAPSPAAEARRLCLGRPVTVVGTSGSDRLVGSSGPDVILGLGGRDAIDGGGGDDRICGGRGVDRIRGGDGDDRLLGGRRGDTIDGDDGDDAITGGPGPDLCFQGPGSGHVARCAPVVAAAGDIACDPASPTFGGGAGTPTACRMRATSNLLLRTNPAAVLALGDLQYPNGSLDRFLASYDPSWGRAQAITRPAPGNHEYQTSAGAGFFAYFGRAAGNPAEGWYGFDLGGWRVMALNSECAQVGGCGPGSSQLAWVEADLAAHPAACTLAYWHRPRFTSSADHTGDPAYEPLWEALDAAGAELVLNGHAHVYERFAPQTPGGAPDPAGIREFVVGTGGKDLTGFAAPAPNSEVRQAESFGILEVALGRGRYGWRFVPVEGSSFTDEGSARCH